MYLGDRFGLNDTVLTNLGAAITGDVFRSICKPHWSPANQRIYFVVGCGYTGIHFEWLYSVDLAGNLRLEFDPTVSNTPSNTTVIDVSIRTVMSVTDSPVYVTTFSQEPGSGIVWRILALDSVGNSSTVFEAINPVEGDFLQTASLSPNGQYMALAGNELGSGVNGGLAIVDLNSLGVIASKPAGTMDIACTMIWHDSQTLIYSQIEFGTCTRFNISTAVVSYDFANDSTMTLVSDTETAAVLLPVP